MKLILDRDIGWRCRCVVSWCDIDLTFELAVVTLTFKILCWPYLKNRKVSEVTVVGGVGVHHHGTFSLS